MEELLSLLRACNEPSLGPLMAATVAEDRVQRTGVGIGVLMEISQNFEIGRRLSTALERFHHDCWNSFSRCWSVVGCRCCAVRDEKNLLAHIFNILFWVALMFDSCNKKDRLIV